MWEYQKTDELYHHGILGQKWGRRRYQNPDGSLTPLGRQRLAKEQKKYAKNYEKITGRKYQSVKNQQSNEKATKDYTLDELRKKTERYKAEYDYEQILDKLNSSRNKSSNASYQVSQQTINDGKKQATESFGKKLKDNVIKAAVLESGKHLLTGALNRIGDNLLKERDPNAKLKAEVNVLDLESKKASSIDNLEKREINKINNQYSRVKIDDEFNYYLKNRNDPKFIEKLYKNKNNNKNNNKN